MPSPLLLLLLTGASLTCQSPVSIETRPRLTASLPATAPKDASDVIDHGYPALAFSSHSFHEYTGSKASPNTFSANLIETIANRTGSSVHIRVGGTSGDFAHYQADQNVAVKLPSGAKAGGIPRGMALGSPWFEGFANFPSVKWTYMAHFANESDISNSVAGVQEALKYIGPNLEALEIGNEIDLYPNDNRPKGYNAAQYVEQWHEYEDAITKAFGEKQYQAPVFANNKCPFCIANTFQKGQDSKKNVRSAALHHYMDEGPVPVSDVQSHYLNHSRIVDQTSAFQLPVAFLKANHPDIPLYLAEVNSNTYSTDNYDVLGTFGSALWLVDFLMYGMVLNIGRVNVQQSTGFSYASWRAVEYNGLAPAVLPPYYAHPFVADVIGNGKDKVRVTDLRLSQDKFAGYGIYEGSPGQLKKIVLLNLELYNSTTGGARPSSTMDLDLGSASKNAKIEKLTAPGAEVQDASKISWKGDSWTYQSHGRAVPGASTTEHKSVSGGRLSVTVQASEAVLVTLS
ncbi:hypothetical protein PRZ48_010182 [Zasmidium cellare]|uniref:Beta-glucuronidase C-terminal domain-containing protein n=1 Tax=Zasmidium cellare TaxID=395010 RepID=A0ABR0EE57_ZASCE|nr:hypothetical protein PRZ48_010182 [Zasmidium cellare]